MPDSLIALRRPSAILIALSCVAGICAIASAAETGKPNIVIIFLDDAGYSDFPPFGEPPYPTPNVRRLAREGRAFTRFYVPQAICSASRAALMTGCYPGRTRVFGAHGPEARGLDPKYATLAEVLKKQNYRTAMFGKWHLGDQPATRPFARGFDETSGLMYSNDMWEFHPERSEYWGRHPLQFWENGEVSIERVTHDDQAMLTTWYTERAVDFIGRSKDDPFLLYLPHSMPHVPLHVSEKFEGKSGVGLYGDVMMELDWSVGEVLDALDRNGVAGNTLVIFTSDNGPWISYGNHAGRTPFREAKGTTFDGGVRSACIMRFPGRIPPGSTSSRTFSSIDILPTVAALAGAALPEPLDGRNAWSIIATDAGMARAHDFYPFSNGRDFEGVISGDGRWKLHLPHIYRVLEVAGNDGAAGAYSRSRIELSLFDMENDPIEMENVIDDFPEVAERLKDFARKHYARFYEAGEPE